MNNLNAVKKEIHNILNDSGNMDILCSYHNDKYAFKRSVIKRALAFNRQITIRDIFVASLYKGEGNNFYAVIHKADNPNVKFKLHDHDNKWSKFTPRDRGTMEKQVLYRENDMILERIISKHTKGFHDGLGLQPNSLIDGKVWYASQLDYNSHNESLYMDAFITL